MPSWIHRTRKRQQPAARAGDRSRSATATLLAYGTPDGVPVHLATHAGEALDDLRRVSEAVAAFVHCLPARATTYVLTGDLPLLAGVQPSVEWRRPYATRSRIVLRIDPACTPQEVAAAYRAYRRERFGRVKHLSPTHCRLAVFAATHVDLAPAERMATWNQAAPRKERYHRLATFNRDCRQAQLRLTEFGPQFGKRWGREP